MYSESQLNQFIADGATYVMRGNGTVYEFYANYCPTEVHAKWSVAQFEKLVNARIADIEGTR